MVQPALGAGVEGVVDPAEQPGDAPQRAHGAALRRRRRRTRRRGRCRVARVQQRLDAVGGEVAVQQHAGEQGHPLGRVATPCSPATPRTTIDWTAVPTVFCSGQQVGELADEARAPPRRRRRTRGTRSAHHWSRSCLRQVPAGGRAGRRAGVSSRSTRRRTSTTTASLIGGAMTVSCPGRTEDQHALATVRLVIMVAAVVAYVLLAGPGRVPDRAGGRRAAGPLRLGREAPCAAAGLRIASARLGPAVRTLRLDHREGGRAATDVGDFVYETPLALWVLTAYFGIGILANAASRSRARTVRHDPGRRRPVHLLPGHRARVAAPPLVPVPRSAPWSTCTGRPLDTRRSGRGAPSAWRSGRSRTSGGPCPRRWGRPRWSRRGRARPPSCTCRAPISTPRAA